MTIRRGIEDRVWHIIERLEERDKRYIDSNFDLLTWAWYGQEALSQFDLGLSGWVFRQQRESVRATVKVVESAVPLVAFITSGTTTGCIRQFYDLLWADKVTWQKDKYPWI